MGKTYAEKLQHPKWQEKRLLILKRDKFSCKLCGDKETMLQIHHLKYIGNPWEAENKDMITYCKDCHCTIEHHKGFGINITKIVKCSDPLILYCKSDEQKYYRVVLNNTHTDVASSISFYPEHFKLIIKKLV